MNRVRIHPIFNPFYLRMPYYAGILMPLNSLVDWYRNYTTGSNESRPTFVVQSDEPVYDLKDHPDFKYRPGSIVIRVANFSAIEKGKPSTKEEVSSNSGGQVLDNYPSGKVLVWWPKNKTSECWPQDLYKVK